MWIINYIKTNEFAKAPVCESAKSAGYDLAAAISSNIRIAPHQTVKISTGLAIELPNGTFGAIYPRSGIATREGLRPANCVGVVDSDYRGEVIVALHNDSDEWRVVEPGQRIAQLIVQPYMNCMFCETDSLSDTVRGGAGFGSTGKK